MRKLPDNVCGAQSSLRVFLEDLLPEDVHERCNGKAYVSAQESMLTLYLCLSPAA